jgi:hypothetical protein
MAQLLTCAEKPNPGFAKGWGAFFNKHIFVGTPLDKRALGRFDVRSESLAKALDAEYKGRQIIVTRRGLVAVRENAKSRVLELLNEMMATLLFKSIEVRSVSENELVEVSIDLTDATIECVERRSKTRYQTILETVLKESTEDVATRFYIPENIKTVIRRAEILTADTLTRTSLLLLLDAYTQHQNSSYTESFVSSWQAIERWLEFLWRGYADQAGYIAASQDRPVHYPETADNLLEALRLGGRIDSDTHVKLIQFLRKRNAVAGKAHEASAGESMACFYLILSLLRKAMPLG